MTTCRKVTIETAMLKALLPPSPAYQPILMAKKEKGKRHQEKGGREAGGKSKKSKIRRIQAWLRSRKRTSGKEKKSYGKKNRRA